MDHYEDCDALALADLVRCGEVSAVELLEACWSRIDHHNAALNAVVSENRELSLRQIEQGLPKGPFQGVPFLVKDSGMPVTGFTLSNGCRFFKGAVQQADSELTSRMRKAGFVFAGMTAAPEFGMNITTEALVYDGPTRNPWDLTRSPGGSSGGSAAAVAAGIVPMAAASDGAGSIRIPASACGLFGLKPSRGRMPAGPKKGEGLGGLATYHAVSRSVRDSAAMLDALSGADPGAPYASPSPDGGFLDATREYPKTLRVGFVDAVPGGPSVDPECLAAVRHTARLCESLGHHVEPARFPECDFQELMDTFKLMAGIAAAGAVEARAAALGRPARRDELEGTTWEAIAYAERISAIEYARKVSSQHALGRRYAELMLTFDVLLTPTLQNRPVKLGVLAHETMTLDKMFSQNGMQIFFLPIANATGAPAMTVPLYWTADGLPIGSHFLAAFGQERLLYALAAQLETAEPWFNRRPKLAATTVSSRQPLPVASNA